jgi:hypothetical protein
MNDHIEPPRMGQRQVTPVDDEQINTQRTDIKPGTWCYVADDPGSLKLKRRKRIFTRKDGSDYLCVAQVGYGFGDEQAQEEKFESGVYDEKPWRYAVPFSELDAPPAPQRGDLVLVWCRNSNRKLPHIFLANVGGTHPFITTNSDNIDDYESGNYYPIYWEYCELYVEPLARYTHAELEAALGHKFELVEGEE